MLSVPIPDVNASRHPRRVPNLHPGCPFRPPPTALVQAYDERTLPRVWGRFSGEDFTRDRGYEGPGEGKGNVIAPRSFYGPGREFDDRASAWAQSDAWMTFVR